MSANAISKRLEPGDFARLYGSHVRSVHAAALRILGDPSDAEDVTQEVFLRLWLEPERYDCRRGQLGPYLRVMARSRALDHWRRQQAAGRARDRLESVAADLQAPVDERPAAAAEREEAARTVRSGLRRLPPAQREALALSFYAGLTADEVAVRTRAPRGTARSRMRLGMQKLREECAPALES